MTAPAADITTAVPSRPPLLSRLRQRVFPAAHAGSSPSSRSSAPANVIASLLCLLLSPSLSADDMSRLELTDGSIIVGEVMGMSGGVYSLRSPTLGTISIEASHIRSLSNADTAATPDAALANPGASVGADIDALQRQIVGNPDLMQMIVGLRNDPALQRAMADPELMTLISSGNIDALRQHPSFLELMSHPGIRGIVEQLQPR
jgi:hypothetical protein